MIERGRPAAGRRQRPARRPRGRRAPGRPPRRRQGRRSPGPPPPAARSPPRAAPTSSGSASSWAASPPRSCSTTPTPPPSRPASASPAMQQRPGLRRADPHPGARQPRRRVRRRARPRWSRRSVGRRPDRSAPPRSGRSSRSASRSGCAATSRPAVREGARLVVGGAEMPDGPRPRLVRAADAVRRRRQHDDDRPRGDLRPGADRHPLRRRGRRACASPTTPTTASRARCGPSDVERGLDVARRIRTGTFGVNQGYTMDPAAPFGGVKGSGIRPRARPRGPRRLPRDQVDLGRGHDLSRRKRCPMQIRSRISAETSSI